MWRHARAAHAGEAWSQRMFAFIRRARVPGPTHDEQLPQDMDQKFGGHQINVNSGSIGLASRSAPPDEDESNSVNHREHNGEHDARHRLPMAHTKPRHQLNCPLTRVSIAAWHGLETVESGRSSHLVQHVGFRRWLHTRPRVLRVLVAHCAATTARCSTASVAA